MGASLGILFILFNIQRYGTKLLGLLFSPVVTCWLIFNGIIGIYNLAKYNPAVLRAFAPNYWFTYFLRNGTTGWRSLGGVLLCVTGWTAGQQGYCGSSFSLHGACILIAHVVVLVGMM